MKQGKARIVAGMLAAAAMALGAGPGDVILSEIAWMGTAAGYTHEWIELYNTKGSAIDLTGWTLSAADGTPNISLTGTIPAHGYYLLERSSDETVSDIAADRIYSGDLGNGGETLQLKDASSNLIDEVDCSEGWFAGSNTTKSSMERRHPGAPGSDPSSWDTNNGIIRNGTDANGNPINGTPKAQNSVYDASLSVRLSGFYATVEKDAVHIRWETASEVNTRGFHLSRGTEKDGPFSRITSVPVTAGGNDAFGGQYGFMDYDVRMNAEYWYHLEELDIFGALHSLGKLRVVTASRGLLPQDHRLIGNYPNPFNPETTIEYEIGSRDNGVVHISIFSLTGRSVKTWAFPVRHPGRQTVRWFGDDDAGNPSPSGMYVLRLSVDGWPAGSLKLIKTE